MGRRSKRANPVRKAPEFNSLRLQLPIRPQYEAAGVYSWQLADIRNARDMQLQGVFREPVRMAESMRTDDALFPAWRNRIAPARCVGVGIEPANTKPASKRVAHEAEALFGARGIATTPDTLTAINGTLANHGVAIGYLAHKTRADGSRIDLTLSEWPLSQVSWSEVDGAYVTHVDRACSPGLEFETVGLGGRVKIIHGDGRWVVFARQELLPHRGEACLLPAALVWARHAFAARAWNQGSDSHGNPALVGELPEGVPLGNADGSGLSSEAQAMLDLLQALRDGSGHGIRPFGSKTELLVNNSTAWQVWHELMMNAEKAAARIYLGTDGMLGAQGGAPGVDIAQLFGVATTIVQGDLDCITEALRTGVIEPWCAINFGDSSLAPRRRYELPDPDAAKERSDLALRQEQFHAEIKRLRDGSFQVDDAVVAALAQQYGVQVPMLAPVTSRAVPIELAPTDKAKVVRVGEARRSIGLPDPTPKDALFIAELDAAPAAPAPGVVPPVQQQLTALGREYVRDNDGKFDETPGGGGNSDTPKDGAVEKAKIQVKIWQQHAKASTRLAQVRSAKHVIAVQDQEARDTLSKVAQEGSPEQKRAAAKMLKHLDSPKIQAFKAKIAAAEEAGQFGRAERMAENLDNHLGLASDVDGWEPSFSRYSGDDAKAARAAAADDAEQLSAWQQLLDNRSKRKPRDKDADKDGRTGKAEEADDEPRSPEE